jgi:hypothetical protein
MRANCTYFASATKSVDRHKIITFEMLPHKNQKKKMKSWSINGNPRDNKNVNRYLVFRVFLPDQLSSQLCLENR